MARARFYKTLFIADVAGQYKYWKTELATIVNKVDEVVQLGNLIGCSDLVKDKTKIGPNLTVLNYVALWRSTFPNWTQIMGSNEILALNFPDNWTNAETNRLLRRRWLTDGEDKFLVASTNKHRLVTHGGLTHGQWVDLGRPETAEEAARLLNEKWTGSLYFGEAYRLGDPPNFRASPIFADPVREVYSSWLTSGEPAPFSQVHAAGGLNTQVGHEALSSSFSNFEFIEEARHTNFGSVVKINGAEFTALTQEMPRDYLFTRLPEPWEVYIEKVPVVDKRDEIFEGSGK